MKHLLTISILITLCFGANTVRAPNIKAVEINESSESVSIHKISTPTSIDQHIIHQIPDLRSTAGSSGKNIVFAEDGQNVAVIYSAYSGDPENIMVIYVSYSTDCGNNWIHYSPLSGPARRSYSAVDAEDDFPATSNIHFAWNWAKRTGGSYDSSPCYYTKDLDYPNGLFPVPIPLPNSGRRDVWSPCIGVKDTIIIITAVNYSTYLVTNDCYIWRCVGSAGWDTGRIFIPGPRENFGPHFRFGSNGYMFFLWTQQELGRPDLYWPYYCESFDYGETWTDPQLLWQNTPPYSNMSEVTCWWYMYDCEVVCDTPVATIKLGRGNLDYGEIWVYRPDSGIAGNWHFKGVKLVGGDSTTPQTYARYPTIAADDFGNAFLGYQAFFTIPGDTVPDCGLFARPAGQDSWYDWGRCTFNGYTITESHLEFAHNAALIANGDSTTIGMIYHNAGDYPTTGNLYFDCFTVQNPPIPPNVSIENFSKVQKQVEVMVLPNPFYNFVKFTLPSNNRKITLEIFDISGKLIRQLTGDSEMIWDSRKTDNSKSNPGVYFYILSTRDNQYQGKIILTR
jgi:hypothetical protein